MLSETIKRPFTELSKEELYRILDLRSRVFVMEQKILYVDTDYMDQKSVHYFIMDGERMVSYLRLIPPKVKYSEHALSRVATLKDYRGQGLARRLIEDVMADIKGQPIRISGQAYLREYYERLGFRVVRGPYIEEDIPHYEMFYAND
ncbi:MAG: GNAT family N-acetyltransferase [Acholeplasmataceae bacterium]